jgi:hypothetical protein
MATRATIAIKNSKGSYDCIYTHLDGYGHLPILTGHYNSDAKARELVELGGISVLDNRIQPNPALYHGFDGWGRKDLEPQIHNKTGRQMEVCLVYDRDRNENELPTQRNLTFRQCFQEEYLYVWSGKRWTRYKVD